jgi:putative ABC transport system ATP-binding protein
VPAATDDPVPIARLQAVGKEYPRGQSSVRALSDVTLDIAPGELLAVMGASGSGKSTLLAILGCLDRPTAGEYRLGGERVADLDDRALSRLRNRTIGFVFQSFHLIPELTVLDNVETPLLYGDVPQSEWRDRAARSLERVGLAHRSDHRPSELSGGEAQRAAIARALVTEPRLLLADEPTGNLDSATGEEIAELITGLPEDGRTVVLVTHNEALAARARRLVRLKDGRIVSDAPVTGAR